MLVEQQNFVPENTESSHSSQNKYLGRKAVKNRSAPLLWGLKSKALKVGSMLPSTISCLPLIYLSKVSAAGHFQRHDLGLSRPLVICPWLSLWPWVRTLLLHYRNNQVCSSPLCAAGRPLLVSYLMSVRELITCLLASISSTHEGRGEKAEGFILPLFLEDCSVPATFWATDEPFRRGQMHEAVVSTDKKTAEQVPPLTGVKPRHQLLWVRHNPDQYT